MPLGELIIEGIGNSVAEILFSGIGKLFRSVYYWVRRLITGKEREVTELKRIEKRFLQKKFRLKSDFNKQFQKGTKGTIMKVINEQDLYVEFEDANGMPILDGYEQIFKIERKRIILERKKMNK